jgi:hypothetical protein
MRYAIRLAVENDRVVERDLLAELVSTTRRGMGRHTTYRVCDIEIGQQPTTWAKRETAEKWAKQFSLEIDDRVYYRWDVVEVESVATPRGPIITLAKEV